MIGSPAEIEGRDPPAYRPVTSPAARGRRARMQKLRRTRPPGRRPSVSRPRAGSRGGESSAAEVRAPGRAVAPRWAPAGHLRRRPLRQLAPARSCEEYEDRQGDPHGSGTDYASGPHLSRLDSAPVRSMAFDTEEDQVDPSGRSGSLSPQALQRERPDGGGTRRRG